MLDVTFRGELPAPGTRLHGPVQIRLGGSAPTVAGWAAAAGASASVVGRVGDDAAGRTVAEAIRAAGVRPVLAVDSERPTGTVLALGSGGARRIIADRGANAALAPDDVPRPLDGPALFVSGYALLHADTEAAGRAALERARGDWVAVDVASAALVARCGAERVLELADGATVLLANEDEARALTGEAGEGAARALAERFRLACVKQGAGGALGVSGTTVTRCTAEVPEATDDLGAGDAFAAGMLVSLARGRPLAEAIAEGCRLGALAAAGASPARHA